MIDVVNLMIGCAPQDVQQLLNAVNSNGQSPLHEAAAKGHVAMVKYLIEKGAVVDLKSNVMACCALVLCSLAVDAL